MAQPAMIPLWMRMRLAHAVVQAIAESAGVDLLHIKGPAVRAGLRSRPSEGTDVDVIVRPAHVDRLLSALTSRGWTIQHPFTQSSAFDHAATLRHPTWAYVDLHRFFPGLAADPVRSFEVLWERREEEMLAARPCPVPDVVSQRLILLLHAARTPSATGRHPDVEVNWFELTEPERAEVAALGADLGAEVGLAAALGTLDAHRGTPEAALWASFSNPSDRVGQWVARIRAAPTWRARARLTGRAAQALVRGLSRR